MKFFFILHYFHICGKCTWNNFLPIAIWIFCESDKKNHMQRSEFHLSWQIEHFNKISFKLMLPIVLDASLNWKKNVMNVWRYVLIAFVQMNSSNVISSFHAASVFSLHFFLIYRINFIQCQVHLIFFNNLWCQFKKKIINFAIENVRVYLTETSYANKNSYQN